MTRPSLSVDDNNEQSPLIGPQTQTEDEDVGQSLPLSESLELDDEVAISRSSWYLFILTLSIGGLQIVWSVELSNGSPFLLSLGMSKSLLALVWIAGPLTGAIVQPYIGIRSDNCRIPWGKRKPFMIAGGGATILALLALAWIRETVEGFLGIFGASPGSAGLKITTIVSATVLMYILDFAINTGKCEIRSTKQSLIVLIVQAGIRAFIVDNAPAHQQESANAWASRVTGVGNVLGYVFGYIDLPRYFPFFGDTQFQVLCVIASLSLSSTLVVSCLYIKERDPRLDGPPTTSGLGVMAFFKQVFFSIRRLPPQIRKICEVQLFAWIGWFPFLFYITTYIGQLYVNPYLEPGFSDADIEKLWEQATRIGTFALLIYAITSFLSNTLLPFVIVPTYRKRLPGGRQPISTPSSPTTTRPRTPSFGQLPYTSSNTNLSVYIPTDSRASTPLSWLMAGLQIPGLTLRRAWLLSHILFAICMCSTFFIRTPVAATVMTALVGTSWALTTWAPFALISAEIARRDEARRRKLRQVDICMLSRSHGDGPGRDKPVDEEGGEEGNDDHSDQAGIILGLHNVAVSMPQILSTLICSVVFNALQKPRGVPGDESVGWCLRIGGLAAVMAAWATTRLAEARQIEGEE